MGKVEKRCPIDHTAERWGEETCRSFWRCYENIRLLFYNKFVFIKEFSFYVQVMRCLGSEFDIAPF